MESAPQAPVGLGLAAILVLVVANAFFVAAEFGLVGARRTRLDEMASKGDRLSVLARGAVQKLGSFISATQLGITLASLGLGWIGEPTLAAVLSGAFTSLPPRAAAIATHGVAVAIAFTIITTLHIILGELVPKGLAITHSEQVARATILPLIAFRFVMRLPIVILDVSASRLLRLFRIDAPGETERLHSPDEIRMLVEQSQEGGSMHRSDARLLEGVFEFSEKSAEEVMTPRTRIVALRTDLSVPDAADVVAADQHSRYPVHGDSLDDIVGVVHAKDILAALRSGADQPVGALMRPPLFVPATKEVEHVLADMKRLKVHMAVVLDEHGGTLGIVTMEDLLEEIVGSILDEHDEPEVAPSAQEDGAIVGGSMGIAEFNSEHDATVDDEHYNTLGGFVFGQLGRLPRVGDRVSAGRLVLEVARMEGRRIESLRLHAPRDGAAATGAPSPQRA